MQTAQKIVDQMRRIAKVDTSQYTDANALIDLNTLKDEFWSAIVSTVEEDYNWEYWTADTVALQNEYTLSQVAYNLAGTKVLKGLSINYNGETYINNGGLIYIKATQVNLNSLPLDWSYYVENQSVNDPIFYIADNSCFIAPAPITAITNGLKLIGIRKIPDYTLSTTEEDMKISVDQQNALVYGLVVHGLLNKGAETGLVDNAEARRMRKRQEALKTLKTRSNNVIMMTYPDDINNNDIIF